VQVAAAVPGAIIDRVLAVAASPRVVAPDAEPPRGGGRHQVGAPYSVAGVLYTPAEDPDYDATGTASWYGSDFHGRLTANGEIFDSTAISAAHPTLPLPSYVRVTNLENGRSIMARVNDRGPYADSRLIDVSEQTAALLGFHRSGVTRVRVQYVAPAPLEGEDKATLLASYQGPPPEVMLASAGGVPAMPTPEATAAFAPVVENPAVEAMRSVVVSYSAADRILMAFQAADDIQQ
jgi:rare lipoprotein A